MQDLFLSPLSLEQLKQELTECIVTQLLSKLSELHKNDNDELLTAKQACQFLSVTLPTLHTWTYTGVVTGYKVAGSIRYKKSELKQALSKINTSHKKNRYI